MIHREEIALAIDAAFVLAYKRAGLAEDRMAGLLGLFRRCHGAELFRAFVLGYPGKEGRNDVNANLPAARKSARWLALYYADDFLARLAEMRRRVGEEYDGLWQD